MGKSDNSEFLQGNTLRRGWTTGACATAAAKSALSALLGHGFLDPVEIVLPGGQKPGFALNSEFHGTGFCRAGIIKDAGDDPDVTHGAEIIVQIAHGTAESGVIFVAGKGVGTVTKAGLPIGINEAAINPMPRKMIKQVIGQLCARLNMPADFIVTISVPNGETIARKTWNPRLGIVAGISILGTTGIVIPFSCSAWIHSIRAGIDVARAQGLTHLVGSSGDVSEKAAKKRLYLPEASYIDMGDFVGGMLKYLRQNPVKKITIAGGFAKMSKLAQGAMDLHSGRSQVDIVWLCQLLGETGGNRGTIQRAMKASSGNEVLQIGHDGGVNLAEIIAEIAAQKACAILNRRETDISVLVTDRAGKIVGEFNTDG